MGLIQPAGRTFDTPDLDITFQILFLNSQIISQPFNFIKKEVNILLGDQWRKYNHTEKVDFVSEGLVPDHHSATLHHALLDDWSNLLQDKQTKQTNKKMNEMSVKFRVPKA